MPQHVKKSSQSVCAQVAFAFPGRPSASSRRTNADGAPLHIPHFPKTGKESRENS